MAQYERLIKYRLPMMRGADVLAVQDRLVAEGHLSGAADGVFGPQSRDAVKAFQSAVSIKSDGIVGRDTWTKLFPAKAPTHASAGDDSEAAGDGEGNDTGAGATATAGRTTPPAGSLAAELHRLAHYHQRFPGSSRWKVTRDGLFVLPADKDEATFPLTPKQTAGEPSTVSKKIWAPYKDAITEWSTAFNVPAELIIATICTESSGKADARREEPGWISDAATPHKVSMGLMQTLISTARETLGKDDIDARWLANPSNSIKAGTAYIHRQKPKTGYDPILVCCAYNAGGVYEQTGAENHWKLRQYPIGTGKHADRFAEWFGDALRFFAAEEAAGRPVPPISFYKLLA